MKLTTKLERFPGAFDIGENYNQYEEIFRSKYGRRLFKS